MLSKEDNNGPKTSMRIAFYRNCRTKKLLHITTSSLLLLSIETFKSISAKDKNESYSNSKSKVKVYFSNLGSVLSTYAFSVERQLLQSPC